MMTLNLAVRNLLRNRRRSLATLLAMAIGSTAILLFGGYSTNINYTMHTEYVRTGGHLQIQHRDFYLYGSGNPTAYAIADYKQIVPQSRADAVLQRHGAGCHAHIAVWWHCRQLLCQCLAHHHRQRVRREGHQPHATLERLWPALKVRPRLPWKAQQTTLPLLAPGWRGFCSCVMR
jgi:hypothetical protein